MLAVDRQSTRLFARRDWPVVLNRELGRVELYYFALVFDIDEDMALLVRDRKLRLATQRDRARHGPVFASIAVASLLDSIEREDSLRGRIENDRVGILASWSAAEDLERFKIKNGYGAIPTIAREPLAESRRERNSMHSVRVRNVTDDSSRVRVDHHHVRAA